MALFSYTKVGVGDVIESTGTLVLRALGHISVDNKRVTDLANPTGPQDAATKFYVDAAVAGIVTPTLTNVLTAGNNAGALQIVNLANPTLAQDAATKFYVDAGDAATLASANAHADAGDVTTLASANAYTDAAVAAVPVAPLASVLVAGNSAGAKIVNLTDPTAAQDAATKNYVDTRPAPPADTLTAVLTAGNNAGALQIVNLANPLLAQDAATKFYVDGAVKLSVGTNKINVSNGTGGWSDTTFTVVGGNNIQSSGDMTLTTLGNELHFDDQSAARFNFGGNGPFEVTGPGAVVFNGAVGGSGGTFQVQNFSTFIMAGQDTGEARIQNYTNFSQYVVDGGIQTFGGAGTFKVEHPAGGLSLVLQPATSDSKAAGRALTWDGTKNVYAEMVPAASVTPEKLLGVWRELDLSGTDIVTGTTIALSPRQVSGPWPETGSFVQAVPYTGWYRISGEARITSTATTSPLRRYMYPQINGLTAITYPIAAGDRFSALPADQFDVTGMGRMVFLQAGDTVGFTPGSGTWTFIGSANTVRIEWVSGPTPEPVWPVSVPLPDAWWDVNHPGTVVTSGLIESVVNRGTNLSIGPLTQVTPASRPPAVRYNGRLAADLSGATSLKGPSSVGSPFNVFHTPGTNCTFAAFLNLNTIVNNRVYPVTKVSTTGTNKGLLHRVIAPNWEILVSDGVTHTLAAAAAAPVGPNRTVLRKSNLTYDTKLNGATGISPSAASALIGGDGTFGFAINDAGNPCNGVFGEYMAWLTVRLSDAQAAAVNAYMLEKWGP